MTSARSITKPHDSAVAVLLAGPAARFLLPLARDAGVSPLAVTVASAFLAGMGGALLYSRVWLPAAGLLVFLSFVLDCLDGQLARSTGKTSHFGAYSDAMSDVAKVGWLVAALGFPAGSAGLAFWVFLWFVLCQHHVHVVEGFPQVEAAAYERDAPSWRQRLRAGGQRIDLAFAIGEVFVVIALAGVFDLAREGMVILAVVLPVQYMSYATRFWKVRYRSEGS